MERGRTFQKLVGVVLSLIGWVSMDELTYCAFSADKPDFSPSLQFLVLCAPLEQNSAQNAVVLRQSMFLGASDPAGISFNGKETEASNGSFNSSYFCTEFPPLKSTTIYLPVEEASRGLGT